MLERLHRAFQQNCDQRSFCAAFVHLAETLTRSRCCLALLSEGNGGFTPVFSTGTGPSLGCDFAPLLMRLSSLIDSGEPSPGTAQQLLQIPAGEVARAIELGPESHLLLLKRRNSRQANLLMGVLLLSGVPGADAVAELQFLSQHFVHLMERIEFQQWAESRGFRSRIIGMSPAMIRTEQLVKKFGASDCPVLVRGETGSGKELVAQLIHYHSARRPGPFIVINCGAFSSDDLLASELFGHVRGAFTDASRSKKGKFELAHGGTLFLDEVACMRPAMQVLLLRALRYGDIQKVGDEQSQTTVNVRIVAATNQSLRELVAQGRFREDVYSRLRVARVLVPSLSERSEDIPCLAEYFLQQICSKAHGTRKYLSPESIDLLRSHVWTDNVAGLENAVTAGYLMCDGEYIQPSDLYPHLSLDAADAGHSLVEQTVSPSISLAEARAEFEARYVLTILEKSSGNVTQAARVLGISRQGLQKMLRRLREKTLPSPDCNLQRPAA